MPARKLASSGAQALSLPAYLLSLATCLVACGGGAGSPDRAPESSAAAPGEDIEAQIRALEALGYAGASPAGDLEQPTGVVHHDPELAEQGLNLVTSGHGPEAVLHDMEGRVLHTWRKAFHEVWPDREAGVKSIPNAWRRVRLERDGSLFAIFEGLGLVKLDRDSNLLWAHDGRAHHALDVAADGRVFVLTRRARVLERFSAERVILEDFVTILSAEGLELDSISLIECFERAGPRVETARVMERVASGGDVFHTNALQLLHRDWPEANGEFEAGRVLISILRSSHLALVDLDRRACVWTLAGSWRSQHDPTLLDGGRLLLFDNRGLRKRSRVLELEPATGEVVWSYQQDERGAFYSATCGTSQRLPGGNTLITETESGRAFEVTRGGEVVWEYRTPFRAGERGELRAWLFELRRLPLDFAADFLE